MRYIKSRILFLLLLLVAIPAISYASKKKTEKKIASEEISETNERKFSYYYHEAVRQREIENYDIAIELLTKCYHINNTEPALMYEFANIYMSIGNVDYAIFYLTSAVKLDNENIWYQVNLANLYLAIGDIKTATSVYEYALKKHPEKEDLSYNLIELYMKQQRYDNAIAILNKIEKKQGISEEISFEKYRIYSNLKEDKKAIKEIDVLMNKFPRDMKYRILRGNLYFENNDLPRAYEFYTYALSQDPDNGLGRLSMAEYYEKTEEQDKAIAEMDYVLRSKNIDIETKIGILDRYLNLLDGLDKWEKRTPGLFETLLEIHPNVIEIHFYYAAYLMAMERDDDALKELETVLDIDPKSKQAFGSIIDIKIRQDKMEDVIDIANKAIAAFPEVPEWYLYQGIAYFQLKQLDKAIVAYQKGLALVPEGKESSKSEFYGQLGDSYFEKQDKDAAFDNYEKALQNNPMNRHVLNNYSYYLAEEKKDLQKAEIMIKECIKYDPSNSTTLDTYAWVLFRQGYFNLAKRYIEEAIKYGGDSSDVIIEHYGDVLYKTGDIEKAVEMWKKSLEMGNKSTTLPLKIEKQEYIE